jgi:transposase
MASIILSSRQRIELANYVHHAPSARECCRGLAVLWLAEGQRPDHVAELLHVSHQTVYNWAGRFQQREGLELRSRLADAPRHGRPPSALGIIDPLIAEVIDTDPRKLGYHATVWTAPLLREFLDQVHGIAVSQKSVTFAIARLRMRWKRPRHQLALRPEHWRQSKGG